MTQTDQRMRLLCTWKYSPPFFFRPFHSLSAGESKPVWIPMSLIISLLTLCVWANSRRGETISKRRGTENNMGKNTPECNNLGNKWFEWLNNANTSKSFVLKNNILLNLFRIALHCTSSWNIDKVYCKFIWPLTSISVLDPTLNLTFQLTKHWILVCQVQKIWEDKTQDPY